MGSKLTSILVVTALFVAPVPAIAGPVERACNKSDRNAATRRLCNCIGQVSEFKLTRKDQRMAASFFKDPAKAQVIRQSDNRNHEAFWKRYKDFAATARTSCKAAS